MWHLAAVFALVAGLVTLLPGADFAVVLRSAANRGRTSGVVTAAGVAVGVMAWATATAVGLSALLIAVPSALRVLRIVGGIYLIGLGIGVGVSTVVPQFAPGAGKPYRTGGFPTGLLANLTNPKVGIFYLSVVPGLLPPHANVVEMTLMLGSIHATESAAWLSAVACIVGASRLLGRPRIRRGLQAVTAVTLIALGCAVACDFF